MQYLFAVKDSLSNQEITQAKRAVHIDGVASQIMVVLTSNTYLIALALGLGLNSAYVGLLAAIPMLANAFQIAGVFLLEAIPNRKGIVVGLSILARMSLFLIALVPLFFENSFGLTIIFSSLVLNTIAGSISGLSWSTWMRDLIPQKELGSFFSRRIRYATIAGVLANLTAAVGVDWVIQRYPEYELYGYGALFAIGAIVGLIGMGAMLFAQEPKMKKGPEINVWKKLQRPFKDENFVHLLRFTSIWNFSVNIAVPFFTVYMLERLGLSLLWIVGLSIIGELAFIGFVTIWGYLADTFSNKSVLNTTTILLIITILLWTFTTFPDAHQFTIPILILVHILGGISISGLNLASGNIAMKLSPNEESSTYLAVHNLINSIASGIAPILGGAVFFLVESLKVQLSLEVVNQNEVSVIPTISIESWDFYFIGAAIIGLVAMYFLAYVDEEGEHVSRKKLAKHMTGIVRRATLRASMTSIRSVTSSPWVIIEVMKKTGRKNQ